MTNFIENNLYKFTKTFPSQFQKIIVRFLLSIFYFTFDRKFSNSLLYRAFCGFLRVVVLFFYLFRPTLIPICPVIVFNRFQALDTNSFILYCV